MKAKIVLLPGDGIGPEIMEQAVKVLQAVAGRRGHQFELREELIGGVAIDRTGQPLPQRTLDGIKIVVDCAHGAAYECGPEALRRAGATVIPINDTPDGELINVECGSLHPQRLAERVLAEGADLGVAFDGDADRAVFVDAAGRPRPDAGGVRGSGDAGLPRRHP